PPAQAPAVGRQPLAGLPRLGDHRRPGLDQSVVRPDPLGVERVPPLPAVPVSQPRIPLLRPRAGRAHAPGLRGGAPRRVGPARADPGPPDRATPAISPAFHAHRTHDPVAAGTPAAVVRLLRDASLPRPWRDASQPDPADPFPADDGDGPRRREIG